MFELQNSCPDTNKEGLLNSLGDEISLLTQVKQQVEEAIARSVSEGLSATFATASSAAPSRQATSSSPSYSGPYLIASNVTDSSLVDPRWGQGQGQSSSVDHMQRQEQGQGQGQGQAPSSRIRGYWNSTDQRAMSSRSLTHTYGDFSSDCAVTEIEGDEDDPLRGNWTALEEQL